VYVEGVGVRFPKLGGGAFGWGLNAQIIEGYVALVDRRMRAERVRLQPWRVQRAEPRGHDRHVRKGAPTP
jgi:hypothetical protein